MAFRSTVAWRIGLLGLAAAGALAGSAGSAAAQYYYYENRPYPPADIYGYGPRYDDGYDDGYRERYAPPRRAPAAVTPREIGRIAAQRYGFVRVDRLTRSGDAYLVDGMREDGRRQRLILDAFAGGLIRREALASPSVPEGARIDPREPARPIAPRSNAARKPPERPTELKGQAGTPPAIPAPSIAAPETPAIPRPAPVPPAEKNPPANNASPAPATSPPPATPPAPVDPATDRDKPKPVDPNDVRAPQWSQPTPEPDVKPPVPAATAPTPPVPPAPATTPPVQGQDTGSAQPKAETVIPPVTPLD